VTSDVARDLGIALEIGDSLCSSAFVHDGRATWMGIERSVDNEFDVVRTTFAAAGPSLYSGTAGIALFLAEASAVGGDQRFAECAARAMEHALSRLDRLDRAQRWSFFHGLVGVAYALARVGTLTDRPAMVARAPALLRSIDTADDEFELDVVAGAASGAPALLELRRMLGDDVFADLAQALGERLVRKAKRSDAGWSWGEMDESPGGAPHLCGFGHGAAGIGWALFALHEALGDPVYREGAREAFRYEASWYQPRRENWPDLQEYDPDEPPPCPVAWCHGAPGIGLSRLPALRRTGDPDLRRDVEIAAATTVRALRDRDGQAEMSYTLCHGQGGLAEFLRLASGVLEDASLDREARAVAERGLARHGGHPTSWASGVGRGSNPSLMVGLAGVGHFYLKMAYPAVPSVLLCGTEPPRQPRVAQSAGEATA
jgi:lantibiotic modifying enzyme